MSQNKKLLEFAKANAEIKPAVKAFFHKATNTVTYVIWDESTSKAAVMDSAADFNYASGALDFESADEIIEFLGQQELELEWIIETHVHADHLSAARYIKNKVGGMITIGQRITEVQQTFGEIFDEGEGFSRNGSQFDKLLADSEEYKIGSLPAIAINTPGHTPACMTHIIGDAVFVGDTFFMPDGGTARADFPGGDAGILHDSLTRILSLPDNFRVFVCHDYGPGGRDYAWQTTIGEQRNNNVHMQHTSCREEYVAMREKRDSGLAVRKLILPSLQVNMRAGDVPENDSGRLSLKVPINRLG